MHYLSIPAVTNSKGNAEEKLCCKEVINRSELRRFHKDLENYLRKIDAPGADAVFSGVTAGKNRTVDELKRESITILREENERLYEENKRLHSEIERSRSRWDRTNDAEIERRGRF